MTDQQFHKVEIKMRFSDFGTEVYLDGEKIRGLVNVEVLAHPLCELPKVILTFVAEDIDCDIAGGIPGTHTENSPLRLQVVESLSQSKLQRDRQTVQQREVKRIQDEYNQLLRDKAGEATLKAKREEFEKAKELAG